MFAKLGYSNKGYSLMLYELWRLDSSTARIFYVVISQLPKSKHSTAYFES